MFEFASIKWRKYNGALIPASPLPIFVNLDDISAKQLLSESNAFFIRWNSTPSNKETPWWWILCDHYDRANLSSNTRNKVRRGHKNCKVTRISTNWLAEFGYECYNKAYSRYYHATPMSKKQFKHELLQQVGFDPLFENWGIFFGELLIGYVQCIIEEEQKGVATSVIKFDPSFLRYYPVYATMDTLLSHYVVERKLSVSNGSRSISHETAIQDFLLKFGFRRQYCRLHIHYQHFLRVFISLVYPIRKIIRKIPEKGILHEINSLLLQEEFHKEFNCTRTL